MKNVIIAGCGRSGTSLLAGTLAGAGYYIGTDYISPRDSNPKGFFEGREVNELNERILAQVAGAAPPGRWGRTVHGQRWLGRVPLTAEIQSDAAIDARIGVLTARAPFCFKDPRFCYTLPVWRPHLDLGTTVFLCIFRHPAATAASIAKECRTQRYLKNVKLSTAQAHELWRLMYWHILERHRQHGDWMFLHFDQMFDPALLLRLSAFTGARIDTDFPDATLRRSRADAPTDSETMAIYDELCRLAGYDSAAHATRPGAQIWRLVEDRQRRILSAIPRGAVCAKVGVWKGDFADSIRAVAWPRELHLVDPWRFAPSYPDRRYGGAAVRSQADMDRIHADVLDRFSGDPRVVVHRQSSEGAARTFADATFDWVHIDADHSYEAVRTDLQVWAPKVRPGGVLVGDDYTWHDELGARPVQRAVDEFVTVRAPRARTVDGDQYFIWL